MTTGGDAKGRRKPPGGETAGNVLIESDYNKLAKILVNKSMVLRVES